MTRKADRTAKRQQKPLPTAVGRAITDSDVLMQFKSAWPLGLTRKELATELGRQVTPTLIGRIEKWVDAGWLTKDVQAWPNGVRGYKYTYVMSPQEMTEANQKLLDNLLAPIPD